MVLSLREGQTARSAYLLGCGLVLAAGLFWSFGALTVRLASHSDAWQYMIYRSLGQLAALAVWGAMRGRPAGLRAYLGAGPLLWFASLLVAGSALAYVAALKITLVANVMLLTATSPLWTALLAAPLLREKLDIGTAVALGLGAVGIAVMVQGDFGPGDLLGNALAVGAAMLFAGYSICLRKAGARDREPVVFGFGLVSLLGALAGVVATGRSPVVPPADMLAGFIHGFVFMGVGMMLFVKSAPITPAAEMTILSQTETIFGPVWVWLAFGEAAGRATLLGGALILGAVLIKAATGARKPPARVAD